MKTRTARPNNAQLLEAARERPRPHVIDPNGVYSVEAAMDALWLKKSSIRREVREGRLRIAKRCGRHYLLGAWLLEWLAAGERRQRS